jgi:hypothetical protein
MKSRQVVLARSNEYRSSVANWTDLQAGEPVEIYSHARKVACGLVEEVSPSGTVLWLSGDTRLASKNYLKSDGIFVRRA